MAKLTPGRIAANKKWDAANLQRISLVIRKGQKEPIKQAADAADESLNHYIVEAIRRRMESENFLKKSQNTP